MQQKKKGPETVTIMAFSALILMFVFLYWSLGAIASSNCKDRWKNTGAVVEFRYFEGCMVTMPGKKEKPAFVIEKYSD